MPQTATTTAKLAYPIREDREKTVKTRSRVEQVGDSVASTLLVSKTLATTPKPEVKPVAPAGSLAISGNSKSGVKLSPAAKGELIISAPDPKEIAKSRLKGFAPAIQELYAYVHRAHGPQALPKEGVWTFTKALEDEEHLERVWNWVWTNRNRPFWRDYLSKPDKEQYIFANFAQRASQIARQYGEDTRGTRNYPKIA